ncbi:hypothetical protein BDR06DRAFT_716701 [Suillus hirtellus]|nr:hypothetical protein BDR06DRAFT_716701 [Suillus hirtellus]
MWSAQIFTLILLISRLPNYISNDPTWWPSINVYRFSSYFGAAAFVAMSYDWALTFGQEVELIWVSRVSWQKEHTSKCTYLQRQRWSLMTVMYLSVRYLGILVAALDILTGIPTISLTDTVSWVMYIISNWIGLVVSAMLWVIIITRLHAMYQRDRKILIFLVVTFLAISTFGGVTVLMLTMHTSGEELILSGTYQCTTGSTGDTLVLDSVTCIILIVWEVLTLCLAVWIAVKHFRELRLHVAGGIIGDCFTVLMKTHVVYFASSVTASCFELIMVFSPSSSTVCQSFTYLYM